jgi:hypothetical protein
MSTVSGVDGEAQEMLDNLPLLLDCNKLSGMNGLLASPEALVARLLLSKVEVIYLVTQARAHVNCPPLSSDDGDDEEPLAHEGSDSSGEEGPEFMFPGDDPADSDSSSFEDRGGLGQQWRA